MECRSDGVMGYVVFSNTPDLHDSWFPISKPPKKSVNDSTPGKG